MTTQEKENYLNSIKIGDFYTIAVTEWFSSCGTTYRFVDINHKVMQLKPLLYALDRVIKFRKITDAVAVAKELQENGVLPRTDAFGAYRSIPITGSVASYGDSRKRISIIEITDETYLRWKLGDNLYKYLTNGTNDDISLPKYNKGDEVWYYDDEYYHLYKDDVTEVTYEKSNNSWYYRFGYGCFSHYQPESFCITDKQVRSVKNINSNITNFRCTFDMFKQMRMAKS